MKKTEIKVKWDKSFEALQGEGDFLAGPVAKWVEEFFGERCETFDENCECCRRWKAFDYLFSHP